MSSYDTGRLGEEACVKYLRRKKLRIITTNFRCSAGEIDIIAANKEYIVFAEVKTRNKTNFGMPRDYVNEAKLRHILRAAQIFMKTYRVKLKPRFDVLEVFIENNGDKKEIASINHIERIVFNSTNILKKR